MNEVAKAFLYVGLGMLVAHTYNWLAWRKYYEGRNEYIRRKERN